VFAGQQIRFHFCHTRSGCLDDVAVANEVSTPHSSVLRLGNARSSPPRAGGACQPGRVANGGRYCGLHNGPASARHPPARHWAFHQHQLFPYFNSASSPPSLSFSPPLDSHSCPQPLSFLASRFSLLTSRFSLLTSRFSFLLLGFPTTSESCSFPCPVCVFFWLFNSEQLRSLASRLELISSLAKGPGDRKSASLPQLERRGTSSSFLSANYNRSIRAIHFPTSR
jgi:hypothetical protein